jgi:hypothetical protein
MKINHPHSYGPSITKFSQLKPYRKSAGKAEGLYNSSSPKLTTIGNHNEAIGAIDCAQEIGESFEGRDAQ